MSGDGYVEGEVVSWEIGFRFFIGMWRKEVEWGSTRISRVWRIDLEVFGLFIRISGGDDRER